MVGSFELSMVHLDLVLDLDLEVCLVVSLDCGVGLVAHFVLIAHSECLLVAMVVEALQSDVSLPQKFLADHLV